MPRGKTGKDSSPKPSKPVPKIKETAPKTSQDKRKESTGKPACRRSERIQAYAAKPNPHPEREEQTLPNQASAPRNGRKVKPTKTTNAKSGSLPATRPAQRDKADLETKQTKASPVSRQDKSEAATKSTIDSTESPQEGKGSRKPRLAKGAAKSKLQLKPDPNRKAHISSEGERGRVPPLAETSQTGISKTLLDSPTEEVPHPANLSNPLSKEALRDLTRGLESIEAARRLNGVLRTVVNSLEESDSEQEPFETGLDPWTAFTRKWGYLPPLDDDVAKLLAEIVEDPSLAKNMGRIKADSPGFHNGLKARNVWVSPSKDVDVYAEKIKRLKVDSWHEPTGEKDCHDLLWSLDQAKCHATSSEALFQRTLMVNLIARHFLIYQRDPGKPQVFDFSVEEPWTCLPMPTRSVAGLTGPKEAEQMFLTQPKPDLALCFNREAIIPMNIWMSLPTATWALACTENMHSNETMVFHFLSIEAKAAAFGLDDTTARNQNLNNASQALFNMFEFFRDAGSKHEEFFFEKVRFFSVVAVRGGMLIRVHRAIRIPDDEFSTRLVLPEEDSYRLDFEYREYARITGIENYNRAKVLDLFQPIMQYARSELRVWLQSAARDLAKKLDKDHEGFRARQHLSFYRYGQPSPKTTVNSKQTSMAPPSHSGQGSINKTLQSTHLGTNYARPRGPNKSRKPTARRSRSSQTAPAASETPRKRVRSEMEVNEDSAKACTQESLGSKRPKTSSQEHGFSQGSNNSVGVSA